MAQRNIITKRIHGSSANYVGEKGELFYRVGDNDKIDLRYSDGTTAGGIDAVSNTLGIAKATTGYEFTGGFTDRTTGIAGASDVGSNVNYTASMVASKQWRRFGFDVIAQANNDQQYWGETNPAFDQTKGLFGGLYMPPGITNMFSYDFNEPTYSDEVIIGATKYTAATGSYDFSQAIPGDLAQIRFDFNVRPQIANTTLEAGLIWQTRRDDGTPTFTFALTGTPVFFGPGTVEQTYLQRETISAYFASNEDVNAKVLPAIRANNPVQIQPLTTLAQLIR